MDKNPEEAVKCFKLAADQGDVRAQCNVGCMFRIGDGVDQNFEEAFNHLKLVADQGHDVAQHDVGCMFVTGAGVDKNLEEAFKHFKLAADQGHHSAQHVLNNAGAAGTTPSAETPQQVVAPPACTVNDPHPQPEDEEPVASLVVGTPPGLGPECQQDPSPHAHGPDEPSSSSDDENNDQEFYDCISEPENEKEEDSDESSSSSEEEEPEQQCWTTESSEPEQQWLATEMTFLLNGWNGWPKLMFNVFVVTNEGQHFLSSDERLDRDLIESIGKAQSDAGVDGWQLLYMQKSMEAVDPERDNFFMLFNVETKQCTSFSETNEHESESESESESEPEQQVVAPPAYTGNDPHPQPDDEEPVASLVVGTPPGLGPECQQDPSPHAQARRQLQRKDCTEPDSDEEFDEPTTSDDEFINDDESDDGQEFDKCSSETECQPKDDKSSSESESDEMDVDAVEPDEEQDGSGFANAVLIDDNVEGTVKVSEKSSFNISIDDDAFVVNQANQLLHTKLGMTAVSFSLEGRPVKAGVTAGDLGLQDGFVVEAHFTPN